MNRLFIHHPVFRLISPLCSGALVYMLILLVNNNVAQLQQEFLGQELYVCIGLAYLIQEYSRVSLLFFKRLKKPNALISKIILQVVVSILITMVLVTGSMFLYFEWVLGFTPNISELTIFNNIFSLITVIYLSLYLSHQFLYKINTELMTLELSKKEGVEKDFLQFKKGINPTLMYETLEALILLLKKDKDKAELLVDHFSAVYRYILAETSKELVQMDRELEVLDQLLLLFGHLPYRKTGYDKKEVVQAWVVPGSILSFVEQIIRSTIVSKDEELIITILQNSEYIVLKYPYQEKIIDAMDTDVIKDIQDVYRYYSDLEITITSDDLHKTIQIPKLAVDESSYC